MGFLLVGEDYSSAKKELGSNTFWELTGRLSHTYEALVKTKALKTEGFMRKLKPVQGVKTRSGKDIAAVFEVTVSFPRLHPVFDKLIRQPFVTGQNYVPPLSVDRQGHPEDYVRTAERRRPLLVPLSISYGKEFRRVFAQDVENSTY